MHTLQNIKVIQLKLCILISLTLIIGCFRADTDNQIEIIFNKDINNLCYQEEFSFITQSTLDLPKNLIINFNGNRLNSSLNEKIYLSAELEENKLEIISNNETIGAFEFKTRKLQTDTALFIYMSADNDMNNISNSDLEEIRRGTERNKKVAATICLDKLDGEYDSKYLLIKNGEITVLKTLPEINTGNQEELKGFIRYSSRVLNAETTGFIFWNHGDGWYNDNQKRAIGFDFTDNDSLNLNEIEQGLNEFNRAFDFIMFDACLMNSFELAFQLKKNTQSL